MLNWLKAGTHGAPSAKFTGMGEFQNQFLQRLRTLQQALADLLAKFSAMHQDHPERPVLARMIRQLESEIALRSG